MTLFNFLYSIHGSLKFPCLFIYQLTIGASAPLTPLSPAFIHTHVRALTAGAWPVLFALE